MVSFMDYDVRERLLEYFCIAFPNTKPLLPKDPYDRSQIRIAIDHVSKGIAPPFMRTLQTQDEPGQQAALQGIVYFGIGMVSRKS